MKQPIKTVALLAVLGMAAVGCQKENIELPNQKTAVSDTATVYTVRYAIDGVAHLTTLHGEAEYSAFVYGLLTLAEQGHEVLFHNAFQASGDAATREVVTYTTGDKDEAHDWACRMEKEGYKVSIKYDAENNEFICVARR